MTDTQLDIDLDAIKRSYLKAREKHAPMRGPHEGYAVLLEEVDELWDEVKRWQPTADNRDAMRKEVLHVAAMALVFLLEEYLYSLEYPERSRRASGSQVIIQDAIRSALTAASPQGEPTSDSEANRATIYDLYTQLRDYQAVAKGLAEALLRVAQDYVITLSDRGKARHAIRAYDALAKPKDKP